MFDVSHHTHTHHHYPADPRVDSALNRLETIMENLEKLQTEVAALKGKVEKLIADRAATKKAFAELSAQFDALKAATDPAAQAEAQAKIDAAIKTVDETLAELDAADAPPAG